MTDQTTQIRVTLPTELQGYLQAKAGKFGLSMSAYIKNLILNDVKDVEYPVRQASTRTEVAYRNALAERDDALELNDLDEYLDTL